MRMKKEKKINVKGFRLDIKIARRWLTNYYNLFADVHVLCISFRKIVNDNRRIFSNQPLIGGLFTYPLSNSTLYAWEKQQKNSNLYHTPVQS